MKIEVLLYSMLLASPAVAQDMSWGEQFYSQTCAACHGTDGKGGGELTEYLTIEVPDLTTLSARNDGEFPMLKVIHIIDGRTGVRAHQKPMPVFGAMFQEELQPAIGMVGASEPLIRGRVLSIADYLEAMQQ